MLGAVAEALSTLSVALSKTGRRSAVCTMLVEQEERWAAFGGGSAEVDAARRGLVSKLEAEGRAALEAHAGSAKDMAALIRHASRAF